MPWRPKQFDLRPGRKPTRDLGKAERDAFYSGATWMRLRAAFLAANPICVRCLEANVIEPATVAHHREERLARPDLALDWGNLEALCSPHHTSLHKRRP